MNFTVCKNLSRLRPSRKKVEKTPSDCTQHDDLDLGAAWGFSVAEDVEQLPVVGDVRWQCVQKMRIGDVHCAEQTNCGTAADDSEVLYVVSLSSHVDHLPSELRKCVKLH